MPILILFSAAALGLTTWAFVRGYRSVKASGSPGEVSNERTKCSVCGTPSVVIDGQYCSYECRDDLAKRMDDWHDQFEERFPD